MLCKYTFRSVTVVMMSSLGLKSAGDLSISGGLPPMESMHEKWKEWEEYRHLMKISEKPRTMEVQDGAIISNLPSMHACLLCRRRRTRASRISKRMQRDNSELSQEAGSRLEKPSTLPVIIVTPPSSPKNFVPPSTTAEDCSTHENEARSVLSVKQLSVSVRRVVNNSHAKQHILNWKLRPGSNLLDEATGL